MRPYIHTQSAREMARSAKRAARRRPDREVQRRRAAIPVAMWADRMLGPIESIVAQLKLHGELVVDDAGTAIITTSWGEECAAWAAIDGVAELFDQWRIRHGADLDVAALRQLAARLDQGLTVDLNMIEAAEKLLPRLRAVATRMTSSEADSLILGAHVHNAQERLAGARG